MMHPKHPLTRAASALAVAALTAGGLALAAAPAQAADPFAKLTLQHSAAVNWAGPCKTSNYSDDVPDQIEMSSNVPVSSHASVAERVGLIADSSDYVDATGSVAGTARATTRAGLPQSVELAFHGTGTTVAAKASSGCAAEPWASLKLRFDFTLAQPMWATLSYSKVGNARAILELGDKFQAPDEYLDSTYWKGSGSTTVLIPAGQFIGYVDGQSYMVGAKTSKSVTGSGKVKITFAPVGSAISGPSGKAQSYAALAKTRSCSVHTLPAKLTTSGKKIKKIAKITFSVNGKTVRTLRGTAIKRGLAVKLPVADTAAASVKTTVKLKNTRVHGKTRTGKTYTATASYRPCS